MINININRTKFQFNYLQDYAKFLLNNKLEEFVTVGIRFCREADLPLLRPLSKYSEQELVAVSMESNAEMLTALATNKIPELIEKNTTKWIDNTLVIVDKEEITAEDLTLGFYLRRKIFAFFLDSYTKNVVLQKYIVAELDTYTTQEELISVNIYLQMQHEKITEMNAQLTHHKTLLLEAQELSNIGSYLVNFKDRSKSFFTPHYKAILEIEGLTSFEEFMKCIHPDDRIKFKAEVDHAYESGGYFEMQYRYIVHGKQKLIWTKGLAISENGKPVLIRGTIKDITKEECVKIPG